MDVEMWQDTVIEKTGKWTSEVKRWIKKKTTQRVLTPFFSEAACVLVLDDEGE